MVVFDEFHERRLDSDLALAMVRRVQQTVRPDLKIVAMSATLDPAGIARYLGDCPIVESEGRLHPVRIDYLAAHRTSAHHGTGCDAESNRFCSKRMVMCSCFFLASGKS